MQKRIALFLHMMIIATLAYVAGVRLVHSGMDTAAVGLAVGIILGYLTRSQVEGFSVSKLMLVSGFLLVILIPMVGPMEKSTYEKRKLAPYPEWRWGNVWKFFFEYKSWFEDRFAYRNSMVAYVNRTKLEVFKKSSIPEIVAVGSNGWLYMARKDYIRVTSTPLTPGQLDTVVRNLEVVTAWFASKNIHYYFMLLPVKERLYPEYMLPLQRLKMTFSRRQQILDRLASHPSVVSIDCYPELLEGKKVRPVYYNTDTHWNMFGAYLGYKKLMDRISVDFPQVKLLPESAFVIDSVRESAGDLQQMLGFDNILPRIHYYYARKQPSHAKNSVYEMKEYPGLLFGVKEMKTPNTGLSLFLVRDSFSEHLKIFLTPHFKRSVVAWTTDVPATAVLREKPDIVVHEMLEMFSDNLLKLPPEILADTAFVRNYLREHPRNTNHP